MKSSVGFSYKSWLVALGLLLCVGFLQVFQRTAVIMKGYAVGSDIKYIHEHTTQVAWLESEVHEMHSPAHLAAFAKRTAAWAWLPKSL